ncbi:PAS domain S-box protein, partial [Candidatus Aerophobetes bacterium]|nr:PAS domain S-box protein [Candidatus Aerophobetes bacterium]
GFVRDITERKQLEEERARATAARERAVVIDAMPDAVIVLNLEGVITFVNPAYTRMFGWKPEERIGKSFDELGDTIKPKDIEKFMKLLGELIEEGHVEPLETVLGTKDGRELPVSVTYSLVKDAKGKPLNIVASLRDITELKRAEEERAEAAAIRERAAIVDAMGDGLIVTDLQGNITFVNKAFLKQFGYKEEELVGTSVVNMPTIRPEDIEKVMEFMKEVIEKGSAGPIGMPGVRRDVKEIYLSFTASVLKDPKGKPIALFAVVRDITEQKKAEEALLQSERLRALGEMAGGVAHDFNNLLAIILGNAQLLERGMERYKPREIKERLRTIAQTAYRGGETVRRLHHFTQREVSTENFTRIDLNEIVREAIFSTSPRWKDEPEAKGITIEMKEKLEKLPPLLGSRSELMEVLTNLIFNAVEAMRKGGEITIKTKAKENKVLLYFTDTGQGIPKRIRDKIFDPFFTTKGPKASGLGLSTSYGIIKRHKGYIKVESREGKGTTFTINIPIPLEIPQDEEKLKDLEKVPSRKILVIDDEEGVRDVLEGILKSEGHRVTLAETGKKALEEFKKTHFDLVLTDLGMPEMSGWELAKKTKEIDPAV